MGGQPGRQDRGGAGGLEREKWERRRRDMDKGGQQEKRARERKGGRSPSGKDRAGEEERQAGALLDLLCSLVLPEANQIRTQRRSQSDKDTEKLPWPRTHGFL